MKALTCENGFLFNFDESQRFRLFFGSNAVGKTQASQALKKWFEDQGKDVLYFNSDVQSSMLIGNPKDENAFSICPNAQKIAIENDEINRLETKMAFKDAAKKTFGSSVGTTYSNLLGMSGGVKDNLLPTNLFTVVQTVPTNDLRLLITPKNREILNFPKLLDAIEDDDNFFVPTESEISSAQPQSVREIQEKIVTEKIKICPVCSSEIDDTRRGLIEKEIKLGTVTDIEKESLLYYLENSQYAGNFIEAIIKDKKEINAIRKTVDEQLVWCLKSTFDPDDIKKLDTSLANRNKLVEESNAYTLTGLSDSEKKDIVEEIKNTFDLSVDPEIEFDKGYISLKNMHPPFKNLSESEQDFFEILYFNLLIKQKIKRNSITIIMDDPFDSYDDANIFRSVSFLSKIIKECSAKLDNCFVFSHSLHVVTLFRELHDREIPFDVVWLDSELGGKEIRQFTSFSGLLSQFGSNNSDYGLPQYMMSHCSGPGPFVVEVCLLRDHMKETMDLWPDFARSGLSDLKVRLKTLYRDISNSIDHCHSAVDLGTLQSSFFFLYNPSFPPSLAKMTSDDLFSSIDFYHYDKFLIQNEKSEFLDTDNVLTLFTFKVLCALELRRKYEEKANCLGVKPSGMIGSLVSRLRELTNKKAADLVKFYDRQREILCCFEHSTSRNVPPIFVYRLSQIQAWYKELDSL